MNNGFIYVLVSWFIKLCRYLNLVELFKLISRQFNSDRTNPIKVDAYNRTATDIFIVAKWVFVIYLWRKQISHPYLTIFVWYLIATNLFTYFYYHVWHNQALNPDNFSIDRAKRRFINLMLALAFSTTAFAYLYEFPYVQDIEWPAGGATYYYSIMYSFSNSLAANYNDVKPHNDWGNEISSIQLLCTFVFVTIILSKSVPQTTSTT